MLKRNNRWQSLATAPLIVIAAAGLGRAAPRPVPPSPYLSVAYRYADAMLKQGRDTQGEQKSGILLSALDRATRAPLASRPAAPAGVEEPSRAGGATGPLLGANPRHDQNLLRLLYTLSELSNTPVYREAADGELRWFLQKASTGASRAAWDDGAAWNVATDTLMQPDKVAGEPTRPWMLWDRCFEIAPQECKQFVQGLIPIAANDATSPRRVGESIRALAVAYQHTGDPSLLKAIEAAVGQLEKKQAATKIDSATAASWLSAAVDCDGVASRLPLELATRLKGIAAQVDRGFCALPHDLQGKGGFALQSPGAKADAPLTPLWQVTPGGCTTAQVGMMCVSRYENTGSVNYRKLLQAAADAYRDQLPGDEIDAWPMTFGNAIGLQLAAWRATSNQVYLDQARKLADAAVRIFWGDDGLPRASSKSKHYESITGADTLGLSLVELHLGILGITAVRTPANTIDR